MAVLTLATARGAPDNRLGIHLSGIDGSEARQRHKMEATRKIHEQPHSQHPAYVDAHLLIVVPGSVTDGEVTLRSAWGRKGLRTRCRSRCSWIVAALGASNYTYAEASWTQSTGLDRLARAHAGLPGRRAAPDRVRFCSREQNRSYVPDPVIWPIVTARWFSGWTADVGPHNGLQSVEPIEQGLGVGAQGRLGFRSPERTRNRRYDRS